MDNLETTLNNSASQNSPASQKVVSRRSALGNIGRGLLAFGLALYIPIATACSGKSDPPPPPVEKEAIQLILTGNYDYSGSSLTGSMTIESGSTTASGAIGSTVKLGDFDKGAVKNCTIKVNANGGHPFYFKNVSLSKTMSVSGVKVLDTAGFNVSDYASLMTTSGVNSTCTSPSINAFYSSSFTSDHANAYRTAITKIAGWMGKPSTVSAKDLPTGGDIPPSGEYWSVNRAGHDGLTSIKYPDMGDVVTSAKMVYDQTKVSSVDVFIEAVKMFKQNGQTFTVNEDVVAKWYGFACTKRPQGADKNYRFYSDHEEQDGFNSGATISTSDYSDVTTYEAVPGSNTSILSTGAEEDFELMPTRIRREFVPPEERTRYIVPRYNLPKGTQREKN